jgi:hypothetical protein
MSGITDEDKEIAFESIILNILITALEKDIAAIEHSKLKMKDVHVAVLKKVHEQVSKDIIQNKQTMRQKGIKVLDKKVINEDFWQYPYLVRGFENEFRCFTHALKMHTSKRLATYFGLN